MHKTDGYYIFAWMSEYDVSYLWALFRHSDISTNNPCLLYYL